jgi:predicted RNase H-like nuclease (RuvC/YqgF family)
MQKDIATGVGEALAEGLNRMNDGTQTKSLMSLVKRQAEEIDRRGQFMTRMEETIRMQQENIEKLTQQTKHLESLVETLRMEREKIVEEIQLLKATPKVTKTKTVKEKVVSGTISEAA